MALRCFMQRQPVLLWLSELFTERKIERCNVGLSKIHRSVVFDGHG